MNVSYRLMQPEEEEAILTLWAEVLNTPVAQQQLRFVSDPSRHRHTFVAVAPGGAILAAGHYRACERRGADGQPQLVGEVDPVATRADARRQGHADRLLTQITAAMVSEGCLWSLIVTSAMGRPLYTRHSWQSFPLRALQGTLLQPLPPSVPRYRTWHYVPEAVSASWTALAQVYTAANATRPLSVVRDVAYWRDELAPRIAYRSASEGLHIAAVASTADLACVIGYVLVHYYDVGFLVTEIAVPPGDAGAIATLLHAVADEARRRGTLRGRLVLPLDGPLVQAAAALFGPTLHESPDEPLMARSLHADFDAAHVAAIFAAPGVAYTDIDHF